MLSCDEHPNCEYKQIKRQQYYLELEQKADKYKQALNKIETRIQLENADDCLLDIMEIIENIKES
jgi:hypothetical protein|nr:MAG TPA: hypothetical protein [Caudoviricetes sp.]